jgi:hypothetical protein
MGAASNEPWARLNPISRTATRSDRLSTPSATLRAPTASAKSMMRRHIACLRRSPAQPTTSCRATLISTKGNSSSSESNGHSMPTLSIESATGRPRSSLATSLTGRRLRTASAASISTINPPKADCSGICWHSFFDRLRILNECDREIDRDLKVTVPGGEIAAVADRLLDDFKDRTEARSIVWRNMCRRVKRSHERFGAAQAERAGIDLRLIQKLEGGCWKHLGRIRWVDRRQCGRHECSDTVAHVLAAKRCRQQR